jgi:hypothetical protein
MSILMTDLAEAGGILPHDVWKCWGCGQVLHFDERRHVPQEQLNACRSLCDWELLERRRPVEDTGAL